MMRNLHRRFDRYYIGQIYGGDFTKICGLLKINELYLRRFCLSKKVMTNSWSKTNFEDRRSESRGRWPSCRKALIFFLSLTRIAADMPLGGRNSLSVLISYLDHMTCHNLLLPPIRSAEEPTDRPTTHSALLASTTLHLKAAIKPLIFTG